MKKNLIKLVSLGLVAATMVPSLAFATELPTDDRDVTIVSTEEAEAADVNIYNPNTDGAYNPLGGEVNDEDRSANAALIEITGTRVNLRKDNNTSSTILGQVSSPAKYDYITSSGYYQNGYTFVYQWYKIKASSTGWVTADHAQFA